MNPMAEARGLSLPLRTDLIASRSATERDNRHHDRCPRDIDGGVPISVIGVAALDTAKGGLTLTVRFCTVAAHMARARRVAWIDGVQWDTCKSRLVGEEFTKLPKSPTALPCTLRVSNRAFGALPNVP